MTKLSRAAQAVLDAIYEISPALADEIAAAALRAAADVAADQGPDRDNWLTTSDYDEGWSDAMSFILAIITKLENHQ